MTDECEEHSFGKLLRRFRRRRNLNQLGLAKKLGKNTRSTIDAWERCLYIPDTQEVVLAIADVLGLSDQETDYLLFAAHYAPKYVTIEEIGQTLRNDSQQKQVLLREREAEVGMRKKYLENMDKLYGSVTLPIGEPQELSVQAIFQPLRLRQNPLTAENLLREERRLLVDETPFDESEQALPSVIAENGDDALSKSPEKCMIVLGGPGTGKTTLLKYLASSRARRALNEPTSPLPIFIQLAQLASSNMPLKEYLLHMIQKLAVDDRYADILWTTIETGQAFICLDGLDEVIDQRREMIKDIDLLISDFSKDVTWVISSRFTSYNERQLMPTRFTTWELQPLTHPLRLELADLLVPEIQRLLPKSTKHPCEPATFVKALEDHSKIAIWGKSPLLFSLAAIIFVDTGTLPTSRDDLYRKSIDTILANREKNSRMPHRQLAALALELFLQRIGRIFTLDDLYDLIPKIRIKQGENWDTEELAERFINSGLLDVVAIETYGFSHQTFQEYLAAEYLAEFAGSKALEEIDVLITAADESFSRQVIIEFAYIAHQRKLRLEDILYQRLITFLGQMKVEMSKPANTPIATGIANILKELFDLWGHKMCTSLIKGSADQIQDGEVASSIGDIFEKNPKDFAVPALIESMHKYKKKVRFIGALGNIGTEEAVQALLGFLKETIEESKDTFLFEPLAKALRKTSAESATSLFQTLLDKNESDIEVKHAALRALRTLSQGMSYDLETVKEYLTVTDKEGRRADWKRIEDTANWLRHNGLQDEKLQKHLHEIIIALEIILSSHEIDDARKAVALALGELGNTQTFAILIQRLEKREEQSLETATAMLFSLSRLIDRSQVDPLFEKRITESFKMIQDGYSQLEREIKDVEYRVLEYFEGRTLHD